MHFFATTSAIAFIQFCQLLSGVIASEGDKRNQSCRSFMNHKCIPCEEESSNDGNKLCVEKNATFTCSKIGGEGFYNMYDKRSGNFLCQEKCTGHKLCDFDGYDEALAESINAEKNTTAAEKIESNFSCSVFEKGCKICNKNIHCWCDSFGKMLEINCFNGSFFRSYLDLFDSRTGQYRCPSKELLESSGLVKSYFDDPCSNNSKVGETRESGPSLSPPAPTPAAHSQSQSAVVPWVLFSLTLLALVGYIGFRMYQDKKRVLLSPQRLVGSRGAGKSTSSNVNVQGEQEENPEYNYTEQIYNSPGVGQYTPPIYSVTLPSPQEGQQVEAVYAEVRK